jgi:hypothetical protein
MRRLKNIGVATAVSTGFVVVTLVGAPAAGAATPALIMPAEAAVGIHLSDSDYRAGYRHGYRDGYQDGLKGCKSRSAKKSKDSGEQGYRDGYQAGFDAGMRICND